MVLLGLIVLTLASQVIATPHGYGVKGGAVAKAEASASAGAFSGIPPIPLVIPSGAGYSGAFSKSSSSSFSSASSSASSSSSSFSFSGSGANAINAFGLNGGCSSGLCQSNGCSSGACQNNGANDISKYGSAAGAAAEAKTFVSSPYNHKQSNQPCVGENCNAEDNKECISGQCSNNNPSNNDCTNGNCSSPDKKNVSNTNCKSGICGQGNTQTTPEETSPNDIKVNIAGQSYSHKNYNLPSQSSYPGETIRNNPTGSCINGICNQPSQTSNNYDGNNLGNALQSNKDSNAISPLNDGQKPSVYNKPSTLEPECTTHNCVSPFQNTGIGGENRPSSYDVPILGTTVPSSFLDIKKICTSADCQNNDVKDVYPNNNVNSLRPSYNNLAGSKSPSACSGGSCTSQAITSPKYEVPTSESAKSFTPSYGLQSVEHPRPSPGYYDCKGPNCEPSIPSNVGVHTNQPNYSTLGNCGPSGCGNNPQTGTTLPQNPHDYESLSKSTPAPSHNSFPSTGHTDCKGLNCGTSGFSNLPANINQPTFYSPGSACGPQGCSNIPQTGTTLPANQAGNLDVSKSSIDHSLTSTSHPNCIGPNCDTSSYPSVGENTKQPSFSSPGNCGPSGCGYITQTSSVSPQNQLSYGSIGKAPSSAEASTVHPECKGQNCGTSSVSSVNTINVPGNCGLSGCSPQNSKPPAYNQQGYGGIGGSTTTLGQGSQTLSPAQSTISPFTLGGYTNPVLSQTYKPNPSIISPNTELAPPNESSRPDVHSKPFDLSKPTTFNTNQNTQVYTGGFGGSKGSIDQNVVIKPHSTSTVSPAIVSSTSPSNIPSIPQFSQDTKVPTTPPFDLSKPSTLPTNQNTQVYTGGFGAPKGSINQNVVIKPHGSTTVSPVTAVATNPSNLPSASQYRPTNSGYTPHAQVPVHSSSAAPVPQPHGTKDTSSHKGIPYTGGFNGPSGFLKVNDYNIPAKVPSPILSNNNVVPCASNNCGSQLVHTTSLAGAGHNSIANANAHAVASAVAYTGGFGGPPGFLKPYDDGKNLGHSTHIGKPSSSLQGAQDSSSTSLGYNNNKHTGQGIPHSETSSILNAGAVAQANAVATSSAGAFAGSNGGSLNGCSLGCVPANGNGAGGLDVLGNAVNAGAIASAKSVAGAGSYGIGGSYSSSSASAHASAGAATKGGYGRR